MIDRDPFGPLAAADLGDEPAPRRGDPEPLADIIARLALLDPSALAALLPEEGDLR